MKIGLVSDLHIEFSNIILPKEDIDVLIMAGDICVVRDIHKDYCYEFFKNINDNFERVVMVMGNHEHYSGDISTSYLILKEYFVDKGFYNIHLLENEIYPYNGYNFLGCTLWTDFDNGNIDSMFYVQRGMNDYRIIKYGDNSLCPQDTYNINQESRNFIIQNENLDNIIMVTHHTPSYDSCDTKYKYESHLNTAYHNNFNSYLHDKSNFKLWVHGHVHDPFDYYIDKTRVVCNPRGYDDGEWFKQPTSIDYKIKIIEV